MYRITKIDRKLKAVKISTTEFNEVNEDEIGIIFSTVENGKPVILCNSIEDLEGIIDVSKVEII